MAECPLVAYRQGAAVLCAAYGLAIAMHEYGDAIHGATAIASCAFCKLRVRTAVRLVPCACKILRKPSACGSVTVPSDGGRAALGYSIVGASPSRAWVPSYGGRAALGYFIVGPSRSVHP